MLNFNQVQVGKLFLLLFFQAKVAHKKKKKQTLVVPGADRSSGGGSRRFGTIITYPANCIKFLFKLQEDCSSFARSIQKNETCFKQIALA